MDSLENVKLLLVSLAAKKRKMVANESMRIKSENHDHYRAFLQRTFERALVAKKDFEEEESE